MNSPIRTSAIGLLQHLQLLDLPSELDITKYTKRVYPTFDCNQTQDPVLPTGPYRMLVLDGHESHESVAFQEYCKSHNIITLGLPAYSSHLTQPLDVGCFSVLKRAYGRQIEDFIKAHINHITKVEFFMAFKTAYLQSITVQNAQARFRGAGLIPFDPQAVISKLDAKLRTPTPTAPPPLPTLTLGSLKRLTTQPTPFRKQLWLRIVSPVTKEALQRRFSQQSLRWRKVQRF
jgi:hypothetical protein